MAEPTLKDVLKVLTAMQGSISRLEKGQAALEASVAKVEAKVDVLQADVTAHRAETKRGFADLDKELTAHSEKTHRAIEADLQ